MDDILRQQFWWVLCWQEDNEGGAIAIGPYFNVEQCQEDIERNEESGCPHRHQFSRGVLGDTFLAYRGSVYENPFTNEQIEIWTTFWNAYEDREYKRATKGRDREARSLA